MRVVFIGCVQFSRDTLAAVLEAGGEVAGIVTRESSGFNSDFSSLRPIAEEHGIPLFIAEGNDQDKMTGWIRGLDPHVIFCFGWSYLLKKELLTLPPMGVVGYHPAELPKNRGRHPIVWALALGLERTGSTFFFMDEGADSGDILDQQIVPVEYQDDAFSLYSRLTRTAIGQIHRFVPLLRDGKHAPVRQDQSKANYWRKRGIDDGKIDWRMSSSGIYNLVRALTAPYVGAHCAHKGGNVKIWGVVEVDGVDQNHEPGKVLESGNGVIVVKCGTGAVKIVKHEFPELPAKGEYL